MDYKNKYNKYKTKYLNKKLYGGKTRSIIPIGKSTDGRNYYECMTDSCHRFVFTSGRHCCQRCMNTRGGEHNICTPLPNIGYGI